MKKYLAILTVCAAMLFALTACGEGMGQNGADNASARVDNALGAGTRNDLTDGIEDMWTDGLRKAEGDNTNATPNTRLQGSYNNPTGTPAGSASSSAASYRAQDEEDDPLASSIRYRLMLENARVHDRDGFLLDGENTSHDTF